MEFLELALGLVACMSVLCSCYVFIQPLSFRLSTNQTPGAVLQMVGLKAFCDFINGFRFVAQAFWSVQRHNEAACSVYAWLTYFSMLGSTSYNFAISVEVYILTAYGASSRPKMLLPESNVQFFIIYSTLVPSVVASVLTSHGCAVYSSTFRDCAIYDFDKTVLWPAWQVWLLLAPIIFHILFSVFTLLTVLYRSYREERVHIRSSSSAIERLGAQTKMRRKMILFTIFFVLQWAPVVSLFLKVIFGQPTSVSLIIFARLIEHSIGIFDAVLWFSNIEDTVIVSSNCLQVMRDSAHKFSKTKANSSCEGNGVQLTPIFDTSPRILIAENTSF